MKNLIEILIRLLWPRPQPGSGGAATAMTRRTLFKASAGMAAVLAGVPYKPYVLPNAAIFESLFRNEIDAKAIDAVNDFTRSRVREDGYYRRIVTPVFTKDVDELKTWSTPIA
jgi:hypothetical protein